MKNIELLYKAADMANIADGKISISRLWSNVYGGWFYKIFSIKLHDKDAIVVLYPNSINNNLRYSVFLIKPGVIKADTSLKECFNHEKYIENAEYICNSSCLHVADMSKPYIYVFHLSPFDLDKQVMNNVEWDEIVEHKN
jgi:hypothetical protein